MKQATDFISLQIDTVLQECKKHDIEIPQDAEKALETYITELFNWSERINLISKNDLSHIATRHILDSLAPLIFFTPDHGAKILDIGSGAGFPAVPMKIFRRDLSITMIESRRKKILFLKSLIPLLDITDFHPIWSRIENTKPDGTFDIATSRATAVPETIAEWSLPHLKPGGKLILFLGPSEVERLASISEHFDRLGFDIMSINESPFVPKRVFKILLAEKRGA